MAAPLPPTDLPTGAPTGLPIQMPTDRLSTVDEHVDRIVGALAPLPPYEQPLLESLGLPVCEDIVAPMDLPAFDNSAMDGYAVHRADVVSASEDHPVHLPVVGEVAAGQATFFALSPGTTVRIMTGAPVPNGADAVVPVEWTDGGVATVRITRAPQPDEHVRHAGEDVQTGDVLLEDGSILGPRQLGLLASVGRSQVRSRPRPRLVIMSTGAELREPGTPLGHDSIYDANSYMLAAAARSAGAIAYRVGIVSDDPADFADALSDQLVRADLVVTSGGVSKGAYDVVKEVLAELGTVSFGEVAMQPGKPQGFGFVGEDATPIITLPGNPVSSYVSFEVFVVPAIRRMMGRLPYRRPVVRAASTTSFGSAPGREQYVRARFEIDGSGAHVTPVGGHGSHLVGDLSEANALVVVPAATTSVQAGEQVQVLVLDRDF
jgi:molybdopterin molybdotransferase